MPLELRQRDSSNRTSGAGAAVDHSTRLSSISPRADSVVNDSLFSQTITLVVPPTVRVESDAGGVLRVITNAARPPALGDHVYRLQADGDYTAADDALVARVMGARWADGSWCSTTAVHRGVTSEDHPEGDGGSDGHHDMADADR